MSGADSFQKPCPTCGRRLIIAVVHLGREVFCGHCGGGFIACDGNGTPRESAESAACILERAERLLAFLEWEAEERRRSERLRCLALEDKSNGRAGRIVGEARKDRTAIALRSGP